jgi:hypothetical protein
MRQFSLKKGKVFGIPRWVDHPARPTNTFFFTSSLCKTLIRICFVSIVKPISSFILLLTFDPTKKSRKIKKNKFKIQEDIHEESLEDCSSW